MTPERARQLLGGLAAGVLTAEEREQLFEAALHDQALFNEVADEMELAAFLQSPDTRAQLANRIEVETAPRRRWSLRPAWLALSGVVAASLVVFFAVRQDTYRDLRVPAPPQAARRQAAPAQPAPPQSEIAALQRDAAAPQEDKAPQRPVKPAPATSVMARQHPVKKSPGPEVKRRDEPIEMAKSMAAPESPSRESRLFAPGASGSAPAVPRPVAPQPAVPPSAASQAPGVGGVVGGFPGAVGTGQIQGSLTPLGAANSPMRASLEGTVHDASGAPVGNAAIEVTDQATGTSIHASADPKGRFTVGSLQPGVPYTVTVDAPGFQREQRAGLTVNADQVARVDIPLQLGGTAQAAEIPKTATALQAVSGYLGPNSQVAVLDFANATPQTQSGRQAADLLSTQLGGSGNVRVVDRGKVQQAIKARAGLARVTTAKDAAAVGRSVGADAVIVGSVQSGGFARFGGSAAKKDSSGNVAVRAQVIDTRQERPILTLAASASSLQGATGRLNDQFQSHVTQALEGAVTAIDHDQVSVTFRGSSNPRIGARFDVLRGDRKIGELTLTSAYGESAAGKYSGDDQPRRGDRVVAPR